MDKSDWDIHKRGRSFKYAFQGIAALFSQPNACIHAVVGTAVIVCGLILHISRIEWCIVLLCIGGVLMAEAFNTAIEALADKVSPEYHPLIKKTKDVAAGAVLLLVLFVIVVGLLIFIPKIF